MRVARLLTMAGAAMLLTSCTAQIAAPTAVQSGPLKTPSPTSTPSAVMRPAPFPKGSAVCNDSLTDSNPLNIATATLSSDGKALSVLVTLNSPDPIRAGRAFTVTLGRVQHETDYTVSIDQTATGTATASVTDAQDGHISQVPDARASITDEQVTAVIPASDFPRLGDHFLWKVEASANGTGYDICPNENSSGVRVWLDFPG